MVRPLSTLVLTPCKHPWNLVYLWVLFASIFPWNHTWNLLNINCCVTIYPDNVVASHFFHLLLWNRLVLHLFFQDMVFLQVRISRKELFQKTKYQTRVFTKLVGRNDYLCCSHGDSFRCHPPNGKITGFLYSKDN